jgi:hypothetical protein
MLRRRRRQTELSNILLVASQVFSKAPINALYFAFPLVCNKASKSTKYEVERMQIVEGILVGEHSESTISGKVT